jgi:hypothetical protein
MQGKHRDSPPFVTRPHQPDPSPLATIALFVRARLD